MKFENVMFACWYLFNARIGFILFGMVLFIYNNFIFVYKFKIGLPFFGSQFKKESVKTNLFGSQEVDLFIFVSVVYYVDFLVLVQLRTLSFEFVILGANLLDSLVQNSSYCKLYMISCFQR